MIYHFYVNTGLKPSELTYVTTSCEAKNQWSHLKSSMDPEHITSGRPHGGVGFYT